MKQYLIVIILFYSTILTGQEKEYIGGGNSTGISVMTSSDFFETSGENTVNGSGLDVARMEASRFLAQAALGYEKKDISDVMEQGIESWIDDQVNMNPSYLSQELADIFVIAKSNYENNRGPDDDEEYYGPSAIHFNYAWWQTNLTNDDLLRHRVAMALSEILVISMNSDLEAHGPGLADYYDILIRHSFGNYRDLLGEVTLHPCMGYYLSHLSNPKSNEEDNIHPDENYAREIMQLFTIGLYELHPDGSRKIRDGKLIPTYNNDEIRELAKVFTGLSGSAWSQEALDYFEMVNITVPPVVFGEGIYTYSRTEPMKMYEFQHELGDKTIIGKNVIPAGQTGMKDIQDAIDILFNHDNTGPFISKQLIQRLVKSNPSPRYINRVSNVFSNNGLGERGDLGAVVKAILMDEEARSCEWQQDPSQGMLREPVVRYLQYARSIGFQSPTGFNWNNGISFLNSTKQHPLASPTVFNFFLPDYQPVGGFSDQNLVAPEFQIHDSQTAVGYINEVHQWTAWEILFWSWEVNEFGHTYITLNHLEELAADNEELINHLDTILTHGRLSDKTRGVIRRALNQLDQPWQQKVKAKMAIYLVMISPDYTILK